MSSTLQKRYPNNCKRCLSPQRYSSADEKRTCIETLQRFSLGSCNSPTATVNQSKPCAVTTVDGARFFRASFSMTSIRNFCDFDMLVQNLLPSQHLLIDKLRD